MGRGEEIERLKRLALKEYEVSVILGYVGTLFDYGPGAGAAILTIASSKDDATVGVACIKALAAFGNADALLEIAENSKSSIVRGLAIKHARAVLRTRR